jgi:hypothetical protein
VIRLGDDAGGVMRTRTGASLGVALVALTLVIAVVFVPSGRSFDETTLLVGFLLYALGPLGLVVLTALACERLKLPRPWRYLALLGAYPLGVFLTGVALFNLDRLSH